MRQERTVQGSIFDLFAGHEIGRELQAMSQWLDDRRALLGLVAGDLGRHGVKATGRQGLPAASVLRCALLKQYRQLSDQELAPRGEEALAGDRVHPRPAQTGAARSRADQDHPRDLGLSAPGRRATRPSGRPAGCALAAPSPALPAADRADHHPDRATGAGRRAGAGRRQSLFEPHADIIVKGSRDVDDGHKLNLTAGQSGLILDRVIEAGNPADSGRLVPMLERHLAFWGAAPRQAAADGGFASRDNLAQAKAGGVQDMAFHQKGGLRIEDMVRSRWVYRKLRNFRAGIEADIACLKRAYGLARCTWRGLGHFRAYVWSAVVADNLALLARLRPA